MKKRYEIIINGCNDCTIWTLRDLLTRDEAYITIGQRVAVDFYSQAACRLEGQHKAFEMESSSSFESAVGVVATTFECLAVGTMVLRHQFIAFVRNDGMHPNRYMHRSQFPPARANVTPSPSAEGEGRGEGSASPVGRAPSTPSLSVTVITPQLQPQ